VSRVFPDGTDDEPDGTILVSHSVGYDADNEEFLVGEYATCSGWASATDVVFNSDGDVDHENVGGLSSLLYFGHGEFYFNVTTKSVDPVLCTEDANSGIGNNCDKSTDQQNKKHGGGSSSNTAGSSLSCRNLDLNVPPTFPGTVQTFQFHCADGVSVTGFLTLVPTLLDPDGITATAQVAPAFTHCSALRVEEGACTVQYGGIPKKFIKVKGKLVEVVDVEACLTAFPLGSVINSLYDPNSADSQQDQPLVAGAILFYQETAYTGECVDNLPTEEGSPTTAYGRYCQSDIDTFDDNLEGNRFNDPVGVDGFDNELRICPSTGSQIPHIAGQDVETIELSDLIVEGQPNLNLNCSTGGNTDSGGFKVTITDQAKMLASNVLHFPLAVAPTLEGISPSKAVIISEFGVDTLELTYPTCGETQFEGLSFNVVTNNMLTVDDNNTNVVVELLGQSDTADTSLSQSIKALIEIKVNGLK
jgi:hypothetical protein